MNNMDQLENKCQRRRAVRDSLKDNRFKLSEDPEQRKKIANIREIANEFAAKHPEFISLQLFGSLIKGYSVESSDVDAIVVIDEDRMTGEKEKNHRNEVADTIASNFVAKENILNTLKTQIKENLNLSDEQVKSIKLKEISEESIKESLVQAPWNLDYLFYPPIGTTRIRDYRRIIFDELKKRGELGERIWQRIMDRLCFRERGGGLGGMKSKHLYPQTLAEGEKRFL